MTDYQIFKRVLCGSEVTIKNDYAWLDKYKKYDEVDYNFVMMLCHIEIIELDSGNWDEQETHYFLNSDFVKVENKIRHVSIRKIEEHLNEYRTSSGKFPTAFSRLLKAFERIKRTSKLQAIERAEYK